MPIRDSWPEICSRDVVVVGRKSAGNSGGARCNRRSGRQRSFFVRAFHEDRAVGDRSPVPGPLFDPDFAKSERRRSVEGGREGGGGLARFCAGILRCFGARLIGDGAVFGLGVEG